MHHNLVSYNELAGSYEDPHNTELLSEYYQCLIESNDDQQAKRICKEVLM